jgi:hypothetical protein
MLFFVLGPLGLPLVWKSPRFARGAKVALTLIMVVYTILLVELTLRTFRAVTEEINRFNATMQF